MSTLALPIVVPESSVIAQIGALLRYLLTAIGGFAIGKGWIASDLLELLTGLLTVAAPTAYGIWLTWRNRRALVAAAEVAPDAVALVRR